MVLYVLSMGGAAWALRGVEVRGAWPIVVGLLPTLPMLLMMHGYLRMVRHQDELYRRVQLEAIAVAAGITIVFCFTSWFLEAFGVIAHVNVQWAGILLFFSYAASAGILMRRYT
jgi:hypothetical protein